MEQIEDEEINPLVDMELSVELSDINMDDKLKPINNFKELPKVRYENARNEKIKLRIKPSKDAVYGSRKINKYLGVIGSRKIKKKR